MITRLRNAHFPSDDGTLPFAPTSDPFFSISGRHGQAAIQALHSREEHDPTPAGAVASESDHETDPASETTLGEVLVVEDGVERHPKRDEMVGTPLWGDGHVSGALCAVDDDGVSSDPPSDSPHHFVAHLCNNSTLLSDAPLSGYTSSWTSSTSLEELRLREPPRLRSCPLGVEAIAKSLDVSPFLILECVHKFFGDLYPIMPVLDEARIRTILSQSLEPGDYCVVVAQCAITLLRTPTVFDLDVETRRGMVQLMVRHCQRLKLTSDFTSQIDSEAVVLSYLISLICFDLQQSRAHQHHLGKALQLGGQKITSGSDPGMYVAEDLPIRQKAGCLSTLLYITEVSSAILRGHRRRVRRLENLTTDVWQPIDGHIVMGLRNLYTLFYTLDSLVFLPSGEAVEGPAEGDLRTRIAQVQAMLAESNDTTFRASTQSQVPDLLITRQWSRLVLWHFSLKLGMVTNAGVGPNSAFNYCFPLAIGESLCSTLKTLSMESMQLHGVGIVCQHPLRAYVSFRSLTGQARENFRNRQCGAGFDLGPTYITPCGRGLCVHV